MKTNIIGLCICVNNATDDMLTGMVLHQVKTIVPVNAACCLCTGFQWFGGGMQDYAVFDLGIGYRDIV